MSLAIHNRISKAFTCALALVLAFTLSYPASMKAQAEEPTEFYDIDELKSQASSVFANIDALQSQLNQAAEDYANAINDRNYAMSLMDDARKRISESELEMALLKDDISTLATDMYKREKVGGDLAFLDVLLGATTFEDFAAGFEMMQRVNQQNAELIDKAKALRAEAQAAHDEYFELKQTAEARMEEAQATQLDITQKQAALSAEAAKITSDIVEAEAQAELEAEAARKAEEVARAAAEALSASMKAGESLDIGNGYFANPCPDSFESSGWGYREWDDKFHKGTDMAAAMGTPIYAAEAGTVVYAISDGAYNEGAGSWIAIAHGNGLVTKYMHCSVVFVKAGDTVERGQNIALVGSTGKSTGPHLHFQVEYNGTAICPYNYL